jgi:hypothetical protein
MWGTLTVNSRRSFATLAAEATTSTSDAAVLNSSIHTMNDGLSNFKVE